MFFRGLTGLPRAQDDAYLEVLQFFTDEPDQVQPCLVRLHDHVKQDQGDVITAGQEGACFGCAVAVGELQGTAIHHKVRHHQLGDLVHGRVVVNDQYLPGRQRVVRRCVRLVVTEYQFV